MTYTVHELRDIDHQINEHVMKIPIIEDCLGRRRISRFYTTSAADSFALLEWCAEKGMMSITLSLSKESGSRIWSTNGKLNLVHAPTLKIAIALFALELAKKEK